MPEQPTSQLAESIDEHPRPPVSPEIVVFAKWGMAIFTLIPGANTTPLRMSAGIRRLLCRLARKPRPAASLILVFYSVVWYRRRIVLPELAARDRFLLHFEAVDYHASVWINGAKVCEHRGGYTPFTVDITTSLLPADQPQEIVVCAHDDPADLAKPRGKQDWRLRPHSIWYPRTTGITADRLDRAACPKPAWKPSRGVRILRVGRYVFMRMSHTPQAGNLRLALSSSCANTFSSLPITMR